MAQKTVWSFFVHTGKTMFLFAASTHGMFFFIKKWLIA